MFEPWKRIICPEAACQKETFDDDGNVKEGYYIVPDMDTEYATQFTCPRCGHTETWGPTRRTVAKTLYERFGR